MRSSVGDPKPAFARNGFSADLLFSRRKEEMMAMGFRMTVQRALDNGRGVCCLRYEARVKRWDIDVLAWHGQMSRASFLISSRLREKWLKSLRRVVGADG